MTHKLVPIMAIVEAKRRTLDTGIAPCVAELYASYLLNGNRPEHLYGCVTTGTDWQFVWLEGETKLARVDSEMYARADLPRLLGVFCHRLDRTLAALPAGLVGE